MLCERNADGDEKEKTGAAGITNAGRSIGVSWMNTIVSRVRFFENSDGQWTE